MVMRDGKRLWRIALLLVAGLVATPALAALQAYVDRNPVSADESFTLTLESDEDLGGSPDLSALQQDFEVLSQGKSTSIQIINGNSSRKIQWRITLMPKRTGPLRIPAISIGSEQSAPISLTVSAVPAPDSTQGAARQGDLFIEVSAAPQNVYLQQQVIYKVRLFHRLDFGNAASLSDPKPATNDAIVEKLGDDKRYQTSRNGMRYEVIERDYAIYPQRSGRIEIPPLVFDGDVVQPGGNSFFSFDPFNANTRHRRVMSDSVTLTAQAVPATFHGGQWLPSGNLQLMEAWSPNPPSFTVGQPITRTLAIMADGLTAAQLPPLTGGAVDGLKQYPDQPVLKDTQSDTGVTGVRSEKVALIPMHPGPITLPAIAIPWWNTNTNTLEVARLPERTVTVAAASDVASAAPAPSPAPVVTDARPPPATPTMNPGTGVLPTQSVNAGTGIWAWLALTFGAGWLATGIVWWWRSRRRQSSTTVRTEPPVSLHRLEKQVQASCLANDAQGCGRALLAWARERWSEQAPVSLTALAQRCPPPLAEQLCLLDRVLYAETTEPWQGTVLWQQFSGHRPREARPASGTEIGLRPLYSD